MRLGSRLAGGLAAAALIASTTGPAAAQGWGRRGPPPRYHHDRGPSAGTVIGAIAAVGILAAVASSAARKREAEQRRYEDAPPYDRADAAPGRYGDEDRYDEGYDDRYGYDTRAAAPRYDESRADASGQDVAVNACVLAARDEAGREGDYAEVRGVTGISPLGSGWDVSGRVEQRATFSASEGWQRNFRCAWQNGRVSAVSLD